MSLANRMFNLGGVFVGGLFIFGDAVHWFMTPIAHPDASQARAAAVGAQAVAGLIAAIYAWTRSRHEPAADKPSVAVS
jgi:hypothetical protein